MGHPEVAAEPVVFQVSGIETWGVRQKKVEDMMIRIRKVMMLGIAGAVFVAPVFAQSAQQLQEQASRQAAATSVPADQQPTKEQLAKLFDVMRLRVQMKSMRQIVPSMVQQQIKSAMNQTEADLPPGSKLTPEQREKMQEVMQKYVGKAMDLYPADEMLTDMSTIYQRHLSKDDVDGMIAFYSSPAGQHLLDMQPVIAQEYMPMIMGKVAQRSQSLTKEMMAEMAEIVPNAKQGTHKPATGLPPSK